MANSNIIGGAALDGLALTNTDKKINNNLGSEDFLKLMVEQMKNQSPTNPADSADFLGQLASFSTVNGIQDLQKSLGTIASSMQSSQALQASTMVGRSVLVPANTANYQGTGGIEGYIELGQDTSNIKLGIYNSAGVLMKELPTSRALEGELPFKWDGLDSAGNVAPQGRYTLRATGEVRAIGEEDQKTTALSTLVKAKVESVTLLPQGAGSELNLSGFGSIDMNAVRRVI